VVSQGIAAALVATAAGLLVAIYAIIAYNYFVAKVGSIGVQYKIFCEEFLMVLGEFGKSQNTAMSAAQVPAPGKTPPA
jgi:biopolymer transport protein TolQ